MGYDLSGQDLVKVVTITFAYDNSKLIKLLFQRGDAIKS